MDQTVLREAAARLKNAGSGAKRREALAAWDDIFSEPDCENSPVLAKFYNDLVAAAAEEIRGWDSPTPRLWKFYSSGIIVKNSGIVRAYDLNCGCELETARARLLLNPQNIRMLAELIDEAYYTHAHCDHIGVELADALLARGKRLIANQDTIDKWLLDNAIDANDHAGPGFYSFPSFQRSKTDQLPNCAFVQELAPGCTLLVKGDIYCGSDVEKLCDDISCAGLRIDYAAVSPFALSPPDIVSECEKRWRSVFVPLHEWEFSHRERHISGRATQSFGDWHETFASAARANRVRFLFWGESVDLPPVR